MSSKKPHILVISQCFYPEQFRINDMCQEWVKRGYKITVLTGIPNYPYGKFFKGYGFTKRRKETWQGIEIVRIPLIPRGNNSLSIVANYLSFVISGFFWKIFTKIKADYVFTYGVSPMTQALIGVWYSKKHKVPNYLYVQDLWPENVESVTGVKNPVVIKPIEKMVRYIYKNCNEIFVTSPSFIDSVCLRGADRQKVHYWPQYAEDFYQPIGQNECKAIPNLSKTALKVVFTGNIGFAQGLDILPKVAEKLKDNDVQFVMVGDGRYKQNLINEIKEKNVEDMFVFIPTQPPEKIPEILAMCDVAFISFSNTEIFKKTIPAKFQSYMACGMPILASAEGEVKRIIDEAECGKCVSLGDVENLKKEILYFITLSPDTRRNFRIKSRLYYEKHFCKKMLMDKIDTYFKTI